MEKRITEKLITIESDIGKNIRNKILDEEEIRNKANKKRLKKSIIEADIRKRYIQEMQQVNNQSFLPLINSYVFGLKLIENVQYISFSVEVIENLNDENFNRLVKIVNFINSLLIIGTSENDVMNLVREKLLT